MPVLCNIFDVQNVIADVPKNSQVKKTFFSLCQAVLLLFLSGCSSELYIAGSYLNKFEHGDDDATECIYVSLPKEVIHTNSSLNDIPGFMLMSENEQDSVIASKTAVLDKVDDSAFLSQFSSYFMYVLSRPNIPVVLVDDISKLPVADDKHLVVDVAQIELEESVEPQRSDCSTRRGYYYFYDYELRHLTVNLWLRFDNSDTAEVFFLSDGVDENFHGTVLSLDDGTAKMKVDHEKINVNHAYYLARQLGYRCGTLYVERMLTDHVRRVKGSNNYYFIYNPAGNYFEDVLFYEEGIKDSFVPLK